MKRLISILIVIAMTITLCAIAFADESDSNTENNQKSETAVVSDPTESETQDTQKSDEENTEETTTPSPSPSTSPTPSPSENQELKPSPFEDVKADAWYGQAVVYVYDKGYMKGTSKTTFVPDGNVTRAEVATILYAMAGNPITVSNRFADVNPTDWYFKPVNWAADMGIVAGYGNHKFGPKDEVTRQQLTVMLYQYAIYHGYIRSNESYPGLAFYPDVESVASWAYKAFSWAVSNKLIAGNEKGYLDPQGKATRAQMAVILKAFDTNVAKRT